MLAFQAPPAAVRPPVTLNRLVWRRLERLAAARYSLAA
jgi:hypothetical protein